MFLFVVIAIWVIGVIALVCHMVMQNNKRYKKFAYHLKNMPSTDFIYIDQFDVLVNEDSTIECVAIKDLNTNKLHVVGVEYFKNNFVKKFQQY